MPELHYCGCVLLANKTEETVPYKGQDVSPPEKMLEQKSLLTVHRDDKIKALVAKLATLEDAVRTTGVGSSSAGLALPSEAAKARSVSSTKDGMSPRPPKRSRIDVDSNGTITPTRDFPPLQNSVNSQIHCDGEAREHIEKELTLNENLKSHQKQVLETAIAFIDQLSQGSTTNVEEEVRNLELSTDFSKGELVQIVLSSKDVHINRDRPDMQLFLLDHIPPLALYRMATCLLEGTANEQTLNLCKVSVHFKTCLSLYASQLHSPKDRTIREHVKEMQLRHLNAALAALESVSVMAVPSLLLLQALITGVSSFLSCSQSVESFRDGQVGLRCVGERAPGSILITHLRNCETLTLRF